MSYLQDHLKTCSYCREKYSQLQKPTVRIKSASSYYKSRKLSELSAVIRGVSYPGISYVDVKANTDTRTKTNAKGASYPQTQRKPGYLERQFKIKELGKLIRG